MESSSSSASESLLSEGGSAVVGEPGVCFGVDKVLILASGAREAKSMYDMYERRYASMLFLFLSLFFLSFFLSRE